MQTLLILLLASYLAHNARRDARTWAGFQQFLNRDGWSIRSQTIFGFIGGVVVILALLVVINPEARLMLMFIDSIGVDLFLTMCVLYLRHNLAITSAIVGIPVLTTIYKFGLVPGFWPSRDVMRSMPAYAAYAVVWPIAFLLLITGCITLVMLIGASVVNSSMPHMG